MSLNLQVSWADVVATLDTLLLTRQISLIDDAGLLEDFRVRFRRWGSTAGPDPAIVAQNETIVTDLQALGGAELVVQEVGSVAREGAGRAPTPCATRTWPRSSAG